MPERVMQFSITMKAFRLIAQPILIALVLAAGIGVLIGAQLERFVSPAALKFVAGLAFIAVGVWTLLAK